MADPDVDEELEGEEPEEGPRVGDVTVIPYADLRAALGCGAEAGILVEDRKSVVKVLFPGMDRTFWLDRDRVRAVAADRLPLHPLVDRLHRIARQVQADLIEYYDRHGDEAVFHVFCGALDVDGLVRLRTSLGDALVRLRVEPGSVRRLRLHMTLRVGA
jgi:hypothetical protein